MITTEPTTHESAGATKPPRLSSTTPRISAFGQTAQAPTAVFEAVFRRRLAELAGRPDPEAPRPQRSTITLVVTALRSAAEVDQILGLARGVSAAELSAAYHYVDGIRDEADRALEALLAEPTVECFRRCESRIQRLMPHPAADLRDAADNDPARFGERLQTTSELIRAFDRRVVDIEARLSLGCPDAHASDLDDGFGGGIFHQPHYRPVRIGDLMPLRLANLLDESVQGDHVAHRDAAGLSA